MFETARPAPGEWHLHIRAVRENEIFFEVYGLLDERLSCNGQQDDSGANGSQRPTRVSQVNE